MPETALRCAALAVYFRSGRKSGVVMGPRICDIGGRPFVTGTVPDDIRDYWSSGKRVHIALDEICSMIELDTDEEYVAAARQWRRERKQGGWRRLLTGRSSRVA